MEQTSQKSNMFRTRQARKKKNRQWSTESSRCHLITERVRRGSTTTDRRLVVRHSGELSVRCPLVRSPLARLALAPIVLLEGILRCLVLKGLGSYEAFCRDVLRMILFGRGEVAFVIAILLRFHGRDEDLIGGV